uniref:protein-tyrosine-phosphatase n=1 Tax=Ditylum brightwellii TaxID=49249 RepID=A0A6V2ACU9_9STRA|mmetsp:Transcript_9746/g.13082  ORF Transcript_9746/g.13082 Transcript_9746/m.13082 type:complete len:263 (-) Transcript_9746:125-913(-)|eukprot:6834010-Ditylum_brightwellii.AAC.1
MLKERLTDELLSKTTKIEPVAINNDLSASSSLNKESPCHVPKTQCPRCNHFIRNDIYKSHLNDHTSKITDYLYLGSESNARNRAELTTRTNIRFVLNVAAECHNYSPDLFLDGDTYLKLPLYDEVGAGNDMKKSLETAFEFIDRARNGDECTAESLRRSVLATETPDIKTTGLKERHPADNGLMTKGIPTPCLIHCIQGISRSSTIVIGYLVSREGWSLRRALNHVRSLRPIVRPNQGFVAALLELEKKERGMNSITMEEIF